MERKTITVRRVGTVTFGIVLIATGILFLIHLAIPSFRCFVVYRFWPVILILLGIEVLLGSRGRNYEVLDDAGEVVEQSKMVYDVPAILLTSLLTLFSMCMAAVEFVGSGASIVIR